ncbi:MAG: phosphate/phosphite/phosphonate ABC transporter substrate-binding protein [Paracoccaceae bacterium]
MIASLPMYDRPETAAANDRLWENMRAILGYGPKSLDRETPIWDVWQSGDLLLSQTCGLPYRSKLHDRVQMIATPDYGLAGATPGYYYSVFVVRRGASENLADYAGKHFVYNGSDSQSGWAGPLKHLAAHGLDCGKQTATGGHRASARAVAEGRADFSALDAQTWRMIKRYDDFARNLVVIDRTDETPGLPLITHKDRDPEPLLAAFEDALAALSSEDRDTLSIKGLQQIPKQSYLAVTGPPSA